MQVHHFCNTPAQAYRTSFANYLGSGRSVAAPAYVLLTPDAPRASKSMDNPTLSLRAPNLMKVLQAQGVPPVDVISEHPPTVTGIRNRMPIAIPDGSPIPPRDYVTIEGAGWFVKPKTLTVGETTVSIHKLSPDVYEAAGFEFRDDLEEIEGLITVEDGRSVSVSIPLMTVE